VGDADVEAFLIYMVHVVLVNAVLSRLKMKWVEVQAMPELSVSQLTLTVDPRGPFGGDPVGMSMLKLSN